MKSLLTPRTFVAFLALANLLQTPAWPQQSQAALRIVIVEGDGAINNIRQRVNREPIVQVEDENHKPVAGAVVLFFLPDSGPSGTFTNGTKMMTVTTDAQGRASASSVRPNNQAGPMQIRVTASFQGMTASAVISQTNVLGAAAAAGAAGAGLSTAAKVLIILGIAGGAAAGGIVAATRGGGGPPPVTITPGTPTVGAP
jgi:hypothetical protein